MTKGSDPWPVQRTRIRSPRPPSDLVSRSGCLEVLESDDRTPLVLVSAPAGFGKSTVIAEWLARHGGASAWISLDETDADPQRLLIYLAEAVRSVFPESMGHIIALARSSDTPPISTAATWLSNDLGALPKPLILVLDDFHRAPSAFATELIARLLEHPPWGFRLVLSTRRDPSLPLPSLRAKGHVTELRLDDLRFSEAETASFLRTASESTLSPEDVRSLHRATEGWPVALRLAREVLRRRSGRSRRAFLDEFGGGVDDVREYLLTEVIAHADPIAQAFLDASSIVDQFSAPLLDHLVAGSPIEGRASEFMTSVDRSGLPIVHLDDQGRWFRYHHLIQDLLRWRSSQSTEREEIRKLRMRAATWFEANAMIDSSLEHLLASDADAEVIALFDRQRNDIMEGERWAELNSALRLIPADLIYRSPALLLLRAFSLDHQGRLTEAWPLLTLAEELLDIDPPLPEVERTLRGEIDCLRGVQAAEEGRLTDALALAQRALERLPLAATSQRGHAISDLACYLQMLGRAGEGRTRIRSFAVEEGGAGGTLDARIRFADAYLEWMEGDMHRLEAAARAGMGIGERQRLPEAEIGFNYFLGIARYQVDDLPGGAQALGDVLTKRGLAASALSYVQGGLALASIRLGLGDLPGARRAADQVYAASLEIRSADFQAQAEAFLAHLDLFSQDIEAASKWAASVEFDILPSFPLFYAPAVTQALIGIEDGSEQSMVRSQAIAHELHELALEYHHRIRGVQALCLHALLAHRRDDDGAALDHFRDAVALARPGHVVRVFADLLPPLVQVLDHVYAGARVDPFSQQVLGAVRKAYDIRRHLDGVSGDHRTLLDDSATLSRRQLEVLGLLQARLSNKEIARRLFISPGTVKRHTEDIYQKLGVHDRRTAVERAFALGLLGHPHA